MRRRNKVETPVFTQDELIRRALDMEEGNSIEHKNYLSVEEEKRKKARAPRVAIQGPVLRWLSKTEPSARPRHSSPMFLDQCHTPRQSPFDPVTTSSITQHHSNQQPLDEEPSLATPSDRFSKLQLALRPLSALDNSDDSMVARNYLVHELGQWEGVRRPDWKDTMQCCFGNHVDWSSVKVLAGKARALGKPAKIPICLMHQEN
jgi:hypothetical protein